MFKTLVSLPSGHVSYVLFTKFNPVIVYKVYLGLRSSYHLYEKKKVRLLQSTWIKHRFVSRASKQHKVKYVICVVNRVSELCRNPTSRLGPKNSRATRSTKIKPSQNSNWGRRLAHRASRRPHSVSHSCV